jgi:hypothetical protein
MKAISLWQPWASLWLTDLKVHETRHWKTNYRGPLYVHAAKRPIGQWDLGPDLEDLCVDRWGGHFRKDLPFGAVIGIVDLVSMISSNDFVPDTKHSNYVCGDWGVNRWGWQRGDTPTYIGPWPYKGKQGLFDINDLDEVANKTLGITSDRAGVKP